VSSLPVIAFVLGSMREIVRSSPPRSQTAPLPTATLLGAPAVSTNAAIR
jgi:hypothetical protein